MQAESTRTSNVWGKGGQRFWTDGVEESGLTSTERELESPVPETTPATVVCYKDCRVEMKRMHS